MISSLFVLFFLQLCFHVLFMLHFGVSREIVCIPSERETLLKLKHNLTDPSNRLSSWNPTSIPNCCNWPGVVCNNITAHVVELHLNTSLDDYTFDGYSLDEVAYEIAEEAYKRTQFGGEITSCLVDLKHLNYLDFSGNDFGGMPIPSFLGTMTSLTHLNLSDAGFMGKIPHQIGNLSNLAYLGLSYAANGIIPSQIGNLSNLVYLELASYHNDHLFADGLHFLSSLSKLQYLDLSMPIPSFLGTMTSLTHLDLSDAIFMGKIPPQIGNLSNLVYLDLSNAVNGTIPSQIGNLSNLIYLDLRSYYDESVFAENVDWLSRLSKLEYLDLSGNELLEANMSIPTFLWTMTSLTHLGLSGVGFIGNIPHPIGNLSNLVYLDLSYANGTIPSQMRNLSNLIQLHLQSNSDETLFAENVDWLSTMSKLEYLRLEGADLTKSFDWPHTLQALPSLKHLSLSDCSLPRHYNQPSSLNFSSLLTLDMSSNYVPLVVSSVPKWIFGLAKLVSLQLWDYEIQGPIPDGIQNLTLLQYLDLSYNSFSSSIPHWLFGFLHIKSLNLVGNKLQGTISDALGNLTSLLHLDLSYNEFEGTIPTSLGNLCNLRSIRFSGLKLNQQVDHILEILAPCISQGLTTLEVSESQLSGSLSDQFGIFKNILNLGFSNNLIGGALPKSFGKLTSLRYLDLSKNQFCGNPFESLRSLSSLFYLQIGDNHFQGVIKEDHLANLKSLEVFYASGNNFTLKVPPNWLPSFQLTDLYMSSWKIGPNFPSWIQSQNELDYLEMSNTGILDCIPTWFWEAFSQVEYLNLSRNHIHGELATTFKHPISIHTVDISTNHLYGKLPHLSNDVFRLDISGNSLSESMDDFFCKNQGKPMQLGFLNLASNNLSGEIPNCWMNWPFLVDVNLQSNFFVGNLPPSMGSLADLQFVHMSNNSFSGIFPTIFMKTTKLISLDLGENKFSGTIPTWVGERLLYVKILRLRSNRFLGHIPNEICEISNLQVLDLAENNLSGNIPSCFNNLSAMTLLNRSTYPRIYCQAHNNKTHFSGISIVSVLLWLKGREDEYKNILGLVTSIDLSNNKLLGEIPREITNLNGLYFLNLSHNQLIGNIPQGIGNMGSLLSIDFSRNQLCGEIPPTISNLSSLSMLDLSYNHLKGKIPTGTQLQTFDASNFIGNNLCGPPLPVNCSSNGKGDSYDHIDKGSDRHGVNWLFVSMTFGFIVGFWAVVGPLLIYRSWRYAYFRFLDNIWYKLQSIW